MLATSCGIDEEQLGHARGIKKCENMKRCVVGRAVIEEQVLASFTTLKIRLARGSSRTAIELVKIEANLLSSVQSECRIFEITRLAESKKSS